MSTTVADRLLERLRAWGVHRMFGYPGDGINGILGALARAENDPELVQVRHEEMSAFMACGHAKFTGELGVCLATSGPGAIHLLNGLYDARLDHAPVLAVVGQQATSALGGSYQQEVDLPNLFKDVCGNYVEQVTNPQQLPNVVDRAVRIALAERAPTCLIFPADVQEAPAVERPPHEFKMVPGTLGWSPPVTVPPDEDLRRAAEVLNAGERVAILVGAGARSAAGEVVEVADILGAGVAKALLGKDVLPDDLPFVTGAIGLLGTRPSSLLMQGCDTLLMVGSGFPYSQFLPDWGTARGVQIDIDPRMVGLRYPMEVALVGDAARTLAALRPLLSPKQDRTWRREVEDSVAAWWRLTEERARQETEPMNPQILYWELSEHLPAGSVVTADSGSSTNWYARDLKLREGMRSSLSGTLATMGSAVPYAVAAKFAHPDRCVVALVGDGTMQMNGNAELLTIAKYWQRWADPRLVVLVAHNNDLNQVTWEQRAMEGDPKFSPSQDIPDMDYAAYARLVGLDGLRLEKSSEVIPAYEAAFSADRPVVIDALVTGDIPPIPPHVEWEQAKAMMKAVMSGDPDAAAVVRESARQQALAWLPGRR